MPDERTFDFLKRCIVVSVNQKILIVMKSTATFRHSNITGTTIQVPDIVVDTTMV
jgi:hypothetical protein